MTPSSTARQISITMQRIHPVNSDKRLVAVSTHRVRRSTAPHEGATKPETSRPKRLNNMALRLQYGGGYLCFTPSCLRLENSSSRLNGRHRRGLRPQPKDSLITHHIFDLDAHIPSARSSV